MPAPTSPPAAPGLWETWSRGRLLALAGLLVAANFACQLLWYDRGGGLFAPVLAGAAGGILLPLLVLAWRWRWRARRDFALGRPALGMVVGSVMVALAALAPGSLLAWLSQRLHPADPQWLAHYAANLPGAPAEIAFAALAVVIVGPLAEELVFRGLVHRVFSRTWGPWPAIAVSALLFGLVHGEPWYLLGLIAVGALLGFVWETTGSLTCCWIAHAVHNGVSLAVMVAAGPPGAQAQAPTATDLALAAGSLAMLVLTGRWLWRARPR
ncbi:MAG: CPBP family intramembrane metalloprotease [bacterium]|nr:CPBP family intramembrane metalloprotease [bacterium]